MNKVEFQQKLDESVRLIEEGNYQRAVDQIDLLNLDSVRDTRILQLVAKAYEKCRRYDDAEDLLLQAKEIAPRGRGTLFHLCTLAIKAGNLDDAMVYYNQFCDVAKNDSERFVLQYRIAQAENKSDDELITILENFKGEEPDDRWMYELAKLYAINDRPNEALEVCDEITLWFYNGKYVQLAKELRAYLTGEPVEEERYEESREAEVKNTEEKKQESETIAETPQTVIEADAWDSDGVGEEAFNAEKEISEAESEAAEQAADPEKADDGNFGGWTPAEFVTEENEEQKEAAAEEPFKELPVMEEPETEQPDPGIDEKTFSVEETAAFSGAAVPVAEEDRTETGRIMAEVPELPEGYRPTKADIYRIVPEFETISEQAKTDTAETVVPILNAFREVDEEKKDTETLTEKQPETLTETAAEAATENAAETAAKTVAEAFAAGLTETAAKTVTETAHGFGEAEFDLDELDRFTKARLNPADEAMSERLAEEDARKAAEETLKAEAEAEAARLAEEEQKKAEAEAEAARLAEEERQKAEAEAEAARLAEEERQKAEAEAEAARLAEEERLKAEAEAEAARQKAEAEAEAARLAEEERKKADAEAEAARLAEEERKKAEVEAERQTEASQPAVEEAEPVEEQTEQTDSASEPAAEDELPEMETEVVTALAEETETEPAAETEADEEAEAEAPDNKETASEEAETPDAFAGMKVNPGREDDYWHFVVVGENPEETLERAKNAMYALSEREGLSEKMRMTKLPAAKLAGIEISAAFGQFRDKMVIIENAAGLSDAQLEDFAELLPGAGHTLVLCLTDTKGNMASLFGRVNALAGSFDAVFEETELTEEGIFKIILDYFDSEDALFTEEGEAAAREYVRDELLRAGNDAETLAKEFAAKVIRTAEHGGLFGLFSGRVDEEGYLHVTDKNVRKAIKK